MFWGLAKGQVESNFEFEHILRDIQTLNEWAMEDKLESTAISVHAFAYVSDKYALLRHGGSFGDEYGPMLVASRNIPFSELPGLTIAIPGKLTSAFLELSLWWAEQYGPDSKMKFDVVPFDQIVPAIQESKYDAGLIIHESQLTYKEEG